MDTAAAPEEDKEEDSETQDDDDMLQDPISEWQLLLLFLCSRTHGQNC